MKLQKGDTVKVIRGRDRGKKGTVERVMPKLNKVVVEGVNVYKKHVKPRQGQQGGIVEITKPLTAFQVVLICSACDKSTRVGYQIGKSGKERICKKCGAVLKKSTKQKA